MLHDNGIDEFDERHESITEKGATLFKDRYYYVYIDIS